MSYRALWVAPGFVGLALLCPLLRLLLFGIILATIAYGFFSTTPSNSLQGFSFTHYSQLEMVLYAYRLIVVKFQVCGVMAAQQKLVVILESSMCSEKITLAKIAYCIVTGYPYQVDSFIGLATTRKMFH